MSITSQHAWSDKARDILTNISRFFSSLRDAAPQLSPEQRWQRIIAAIDGFMQTNHNDETAVIDVPMIKHFTLSYLYI